MILPRLRNNLELMPSPVAGQPGLLMLERINAADARGFWNLVKENGDDLKWCGSAPVYTFMKAVPGVRGTLQRYDQWNIDHESVMKASGWPIQARFWA